LFAHAALRPARAVIANETLSDKWAGLSQVERWTRVFWAMALAALPVTSFRYYPFVSETTFVRPLALYPLVPLLALLCIQWLRGARKFRSGGALTLLGLLVLVSRHPPPWDGLYPVCPRPDLRRRMLRAWFTLGIGLTFFFTAAGMNRNADDLRFTLRWALCGFCVNLAWSGLQAVTFYSGWLDKEMVTHWQLAFSMRELVRTNRISGLAYEPAWLAAQIATIYAPLLLGAVLSGARAWRLRWLEPSLLHLL
jgi:hypothetical protein